MISLMVIAVTNPAHVQNWDALLSWNVVQDGNPVQVSNDGVAVQRDICSQVALQLKDAVLL